MNKKKIMKILGYTAAVLAIHGGAYGQQRADFSAEAIARDTAMVKRSCTNSIMPVDCDCVERHYRERRATEAPPANFAMPHHGDRFFADCFAPEKMVQVAREKCTPILTNKYVLRARHTGDRSQNMELWDRFINVATAQCDCYANEMGKARTLADTISTRQPAAAAAACGVPEDFYQHWPIWSPLGKDDRQLERYLNR